MTNHLPKNLRFLLAKHGMSASDLAERLHITPQAVSKWINTDEAKLKNISVQSLVVLSDIFNVTVDQLLKADLANPDTKLETQPESMNDKVESAFQALRALRNEMKKKGVKADILFDFLRIYTPQPTATGAYAG